MSLRVLHVYRTYYPVARGGLLEVIRQLCLTTKAHGVESRIFALTTRAEPFVEQMPEAELHWFPQTFEVASCGVSFRALAGFRRLVEWADVVHYHFPWPFADVLHLLTPVRKPTVLTYHSDVVRQQFSALLYRPLMRAFLSRITCIVATSPNYVESSPILSERRYKTMVIPIGIDRASLPVVSSAVLDAMRSRVGENFFLFVGVLRYYKGLDVLLKASQDQPFRVVIAGAGPCDDSLRRTKALLNLKNVQFVGDVTDAEKVALIMLSRAVVFPSSLRSEAFGITLLEGAMFSKPLISTELGTGTSYVNTHGCTGYVVPPRNPHALRDAMRAVNADTAAAAHMGEAAQRRWERLFTGAKMGRQYASVYADCIGQAAQ